MELNGRNATWLELAVAPVWRRGQAKVKVHHLSGGRGQCVGITVDERWLCANDGRLTVFGCRDSAARFLKLLQVDHMEDGSPAAMPGGQCAVQGMVQCLRLGSRGLRECDGPRGGRKAAVRSHQSQGASLGEDAMG